MTGKVAKLFACVLVVGAAAFAQRASETTSEKAVRQVIEQFEVGLQERDLKKIEAVVADDLVAFENGHRNDGWADFRDHHLVPEMKEPAPPMTRKTVRISATERMGWGYSEATFSGKRANGDTVQYQLWSIYAVERRGKEWKIVMLDWSLRAQRTPAAQSK